MDENEKRCLCNDDPKKLGKFHCELVAVRPSGGAPESLSRIWWIDCPLHGRRMKETTCGHHVSVKRFSKRERRIIQRKLTGNELKTFRQFVEGHYLPPDDSVVEGWRKLLAEDRHA